MKKSQIDKKEAGMLFALCFSGFGAYSDNVIIPLLSRIFEEYPNSSLFTQNYIITGSAVASVIFALLASVLMRYISKRKLLIIGTIMYIVGGVSGCFTWNLTYLAVTRTIDAASDGLLGAVATSLIIDLFQSPQKRGKVIGWANASSCIYGIVASMLAGIIALYNWRLAFLINGVSIIVLFLIIRYVPDTSVNAMAGRENAQERDTLVKQYDPRYKRDIVLDMLALLLMGTCGCQIYFLTDLFVVERGLGDSVLSGTLTSIITGTAVLTCCIWGNVCHYVKKYTIILMFAISALSLLLMASAANLNVLIVGAILAGIGQGAGNVYYAVHIGAITPPQVSGRAISVVTAIQYAYMFLGPYVPSLIGRIIGDGSITNSFHYSGLGLMACMMLWLVYYIFRKRPLEEW